MTKAVSGAGLETELEELRARLVEAEEALLAIRSGHADAVPLEGENGEHSYTLGPSTDRIYRQLIETMSEGAVTLSPDGVILYCNVRLAEMLGLPLDQIIGTTMRSHLPPAELLLLDNFLAQVRIAPNRREINLKTVDGRLLPVYLSASRFESEEARTGFCLVLTDLTEQKTHAALEARSRQQLAVATLGMRALGSSSLQKLMDETTRIVAATLETEFCDLAELLPDRKSLLLRAGVGWTAGLVGQFTLGTELSSQAGYTLRVREPVIVTDFRTEARFVPSSLLRDHGVVSGMSVVIGENENPFGVLAVHSAGQHLFGPDDVNFLRAVANLIGEAVKRTRAEEALRESWQILEGVMNAIPARIFWKDLNLVYRGCNTAFAQDAGVAAPIEVIGRDDYQIGWRRDQADTYRANDRRVIESGASRLLIEEPHTTPEGGTITLLTSKVPLRNSAGKIDGVIGMYMDISDRKRAEESQARLATAVEQSVDTILITDTDGRIVYTNPAFEKSTGYTSEEALGTNPRIFKSGKHPAGFYRHMWDVLGHGDVWFGHVINKRKDGTLFEEEVSISPVRDAVGRVVNYVAVKRDVSEELRLTERLAQAEKMEVVGRLAAGVAHDFNNLLGVISGYGELVHRQLRVEDPLREKMVQILRAAERAGGLTRQLLAFGRKQVLQPRVLDLNVVVSEMEKMLHRLIREDVELSTRLAEGAGRVKADPGQIEQVLMNLVVNARDAMPNGGRITIEIRPVELDAAYAAAHLPARPGRFVVLSVADSGSGMDAETQSHVFEPFFTTKEQGKGTGLGLATVFGIIEQSGGFVLLSSELGVGTTFRVYLPRIDEEAPVVPEEKPRSLLRGIETVLLVEDEDLLREMLCEALEGNGYVTLVAGNGAEALKIARERAGPIDLLLTDMVMPGMTGTEVADLLTGMRPEIKVLFMSGYSEEAIAQGGLLAPGRAFIAKPFGIEPLLFKLRELLSVQG